MDDQSNEKKDRAKFARDVRSQRKLRGNSPPVPAGLQGKATPEEVQRWTTYLPAKPPGRS